MLFDCRWTTLCLPYGDNQTGNYNMKRSTKIISAVALTLGISGVAATAYAKNHWGSSEKRADYAVSYITEELELEPTQSQALEVLKDQVLSARQLIKRDPMKSELLEALSADTFDRARALEMITAKTAAVNEQAPDLVNAAGDFLDTLSSEQKAEIVEFMQEHRGKRRHRHNR